VVHKTIYELYVRGFMLIKIREILTRSLNFKKNM